MESRLLAETLPRTSLDLFPNKVSLLVFMNQLVNLTQMHTYINFVRCSLKMGSRLLSETSSKTSLELFSATLVVHIG